ncbi:Ribosomal large subunit pseudouridine synthase D, putative [Perkinsus marinus ATCC 50983]|uniref:Ribosomal large subunit pseudouridine synthase D, putative n=1 Tax=Perkinsus marinus (strain ATCC 50983 / TXsc) TaxID=423536 RepID=C5L5W9_PERM5|nr:Ribosomal large subunit pseudouridine synthase D, putative [Perkinsus marinus ATCC 50983]EER07874.1 Ribosomal large subunit pseudouridine synthase D, putative [Perkinsus marinus ATCC 50983]|eukprot:XP_002776058.1 Ribosomal large subunit pseudouridine synthase D, putative [Perkinsus marinus ATCC 50983]
MTLVTDETSAGPMPDWWDDQKFVIGLRQRTGFNRATMKHLISIFNSLARGKKTLDYSDFENGFALVNYFINYEEYSSLYEASGGHPPKRVPLSKDTYLSAFTAFDRDRGCLSAFHKFDFYVDGQLMTQYQADGLIIATPSGSSAYSMAAGGSLVAPNVPCILVTPIAPHGLSQRPLILPAGATIEVGIPTDSRTLPIASFDGATNIVLDRGSRVRITTTLGSEANEVNKEGEREKKKKQKRQSSRVGDDIDIGNCKTVAAEALGVSRLEDAVLHRDADFIAINKPWGLSVTDGPKVKYSLQRHLRAFTSPSSSEVPILIHRLDTATAGVQLLARHKSAATMARDRIGARSFWNRIYWVLVWGRVQLGPRQFSGTINIPLIHRGHHVKPASFHTAELSAITRWEILKFSPFAGGITLLKLEPYTGRRDQLQAHCAFGLRTPIVGDDVYSKEAIRWNDAYPEKHMLQRKEMFGEELICKRMVCSRQISMHSFGGDQIDIIAPVPPHMQQMFDKLGWYIEDSQTARPNDLWDAIELPDEGQGASSADLRPTYDAEEPLVLSSTFAERERQSHKSTELNFARRYNKRVTERQMERTQETRIESVYDER